MEGKVMKLIKGMIIGSAVTATAYVMYTEGIVNRKKIMKQCRRWANKMGMN